MTTNESFTENTTILAKKVYDFIRDMFEEDEGDYFTREIESIIKNEVADIALEYRLIKKYSNKDDEEES